MAVVVVVLENALKARHEGGLVAFIGTVLGMWAPGTWRARVPSSSGEPTNGSQTAWAVRRPTVKMRRNWQVKEACQSNEIVKDHQVHLLECVSQRVPPRQTQPA